MMAKEVHFHPKDLLRKPFLTCPTCEAPEAEGLLSVYPRKYIRRCGACGKDRSITLPAITKRILYLDQCAVSDMMKSLNPDHKAFQNNRVDAFWKELYIRVDRACTLQLLVCPTSELHWVESMAGADEQPLRALYEHFSGDVSFKEPDTILFEQIYQDVCRWLKKAEPTSTLERDSAYSGNPDAWWETLRVSASYSPKQVAQLGDVVRAERDRNEVALTTLFTKWQSDKQPFEAVVENRLRSYEPQTVSHVESALGRAGVEDTIDAMPEYYATRRLHALPSPKLMSLLLAAVARRAAAGQKRPPNRGTHNDFKMAADILPYCDAIYLDGGCHAYLREEPLRTEFAKFPCQIFSPYNREELLAYLDQLIADASQEHIDLVHTVYGSKCDEPYMGLIEDNEAKS